MPASAISSLPLLASRPDFSSKTNQAAKSGNGNAFAATLESFLGNGENSKKPITEGKSGPFNALSNLLNLSLTGKGIGNGRAIDSAELRAENEELKQQFDVDFRKLLEDRGIEIGGGINLQVDPSGVVRVTNDHPDKLFIESALQDQPELVDLFKQIAANSKLANAAKESIAFQRAYAENPQDALAQYQHLFGKESQQVFNLLIRSDGFEQSFTPPLTTTPEIPAV